MRPDMPAPQIINDEESSNLVQCQGVIVSRVHGLDLDILKSIGTSSKIHENLRAWYTFWSGVRMPGK